VGHASTATSSLQTCLLRWWLTDQVKFFALVATDERSLEIFFILKLLLFLSLRLTGEDRGEDIHDEPLREPLPRHPGQLLERDVELRGRARR
jgi:hypothetical protein